MGLTRYYCTWVRQEGLVLIWIQSSRLCNLKLILTNACSSVIAVSFLRQMQVVDMVKEPWSLAPGAQFGVQLSFSAVLPFFSFQQRRLATDPTPGRCPRPLWCRQWRVPGQPRSCWVYRCCWTSFPGRGEMLLSVPSLDLLWWGSVGFSPCLSSRLKQEPP